MDTLQDVSYLSSIVEVIAESHHERSSSSIHNLLDAYATFVNRVRSQSQILQACDALLPAFVPLSTHKDNFIKALRRDAGLAHVDPFSTFSCPRSPMDESAIYLNIKIDTKQYARDSSLLCHHALCAITTIFRFPAFYAAFPEHDLTLLFSDVLDIVLADRLPVLNEAKTYSLALWALGCHRLPVTVLDSRRGDLFSALRRSLDGTRQPTDIVLDGLKALSHTLERYSTSFLDLLSPLLPGVIENLDCSSVPLNAPIVLGQFANALTRHAEFSLTKWQLLSNHVTSFLESCCEESQVPPHARAFSHAVRTAFSAESHNCHTYNPAQILALIASLIILCGPALYSRPEALCFILQSLAMALTHKRSTVRALHPHVWRCFVWTFSQMLIGSENVEPVFISSAFHVIKQEVSGGIGIALASVLLSVRKSATRSDERGDTMHQTLSVIKSMVRAECKHTRREGFMFLQALTKDGPVRDRILQEIHEIPASALLDGTIIRAEWDALPSIIRSIPKVPISVDWPEETEVARNYKTLLVIWKHFASKVEEKHLDPDLVDAWLSVLLICSRQLEREQNTAGTTDMLRTVVAIIVEFLPSVALNDTQPDWGSWNVHDQLCSLAFIDQLWFAVRRTFVTSSLAEAAELTLTSILKYGFHVLDSNVRSLWGRLCSDLMTTAPPSFLRDTVNFASSQLVIRTQRDLWGVVATSLSSSEPSLDWKVLAKFLSIPVCAWVLSELELEAWGALLRNAIAVSGDSAMVIEHVSQYLCGNGFETWDSTAAVLGFLLTSTDEHGGSPTDDLLSMVDLLSVVSHMIASAPDNVMHILRALSSSLCLWIEDHAEVMSDDEFNSVAISLYCEALKVLESLPLSIQSLRDMEDFLASAFSRIPTPAIAPFAFERFWRATYHGRRQFDGNLPPKIKSCLACFVAAYGGDLADGLSLTTESQSQSIRDNSQVHFLPSHQCQDASGSCPRFSPSSMFVHADASANKGSTPPERRHISRAVAQDGDTAFLVSSSDDESIQPAVLRGRHEYASRIDGSPSSWSEGSMSDLRILLSPIAILSSPSLYPERNYPAIPNVRNRKRRLTNSDDAPLERSRTSRSTLRSMRRLESEPATRDVTPVDVPRLNSVPPKQGKMFDGVEVPTFCDISRWKTAHRRGSSPNSINTKQRFGSVPQTSSPCSVRRSGTPLSALASSDDGDLDWKHFPIDGTSSEIVVDQSLAHAYSSSVSQTESQELGDLHPGSGPSKVMSPSKGSSSAPARPSLREVKTTVSRLGALQDVYSSVENGASQIPFDELVAATELVHKIGAVLTKQVSKKMTKKNE